jgi:hypothetical protein
MKKVIYKYQIELPYGQHEVMMPIGAEILSVQLQRGKPCFWALVDPDAKTELRTVEILTTGLTIHDSDKYLKEFKYIGTCQLLNGNFVAHLFIK